MRKFALIFSVFLMTASCSGSMDAPKNLVSKKTMAQIMAEVAIMESSIYSQPGGNPETAVDEILKKNGTTKKDFNESYTYYMVNNKIPKICSDAQEIVLDKDEGAKKFIEKNQKQNALQQPIK